MTDQIWVTGALGRQLRGLNKKQREPVLHPGSAAVIAGPGSGKTRVLVSKAALLLETHIEEPHKVACLTFTRAAADEIKRRLDLLTPAGSRRSWSGTVHGFCLNVILRPLSQLVGMPRVGETILNDEQRVAYLQRALDIVGIAEERASQKMLDFRGTRIRRRNALNEPVAEADDPRLYEAMRIYERLLEEDGVLDFEAMPIRALGALKQDSTLIRLILARYPWILVDEYQDLGGVLHEIVLLLRRNGVEIFVVGDPNQCIMGFTGATPKYFEDIRSRQDVESFDLTQNMRSSVRVAEASLRVLGIESETEWTSDAADDGGFTRLVDISGGLESHAAAVAASVDSLYAEKSESVSIGILYKQSPLYPGLGIGKVDVRESLILALGSFGLEFSAERGSIWPRSELVDFLRLCAEWAVDRHNGVTGGIRLSDLSQWWSLFSKASRLSSVESQETLYRALRDSVPSDAMKVSDWLGGVGSALRLESRLLERNSAENVSSYKALMSGAPGASSLTEFLGLAGVEQGITLTTYHSSKGREWDYVFLPYVVEGHVPAWFRGEAGTISELAESRRTLHVAFSRAKTGTTVFTSSLRRSPIRYGDRSRFLSGF